MDRILELDRFENQEVVPGNGYSPYTGYTVFRAWDNLLNRNVVVKYGGKPKTFHRTLADEWLLLSNLNHLGIIKVWDYDKIGDKEFFVMTNHVLGGRRIRWREIFKDMTTQKCKHFIYNLIQTLIYLQEIGILNEDVEMANLVATYPESPIMIDFGRARRQKYSRMQLIEMLLPTSKTRVNAWVRELCGIGGKYAEEGAMVQFDIERLITTELEKVK